MAQEARIETKRLTKLKQYLVSTMVQATTDELTTLINNELQKNVVLEAVDPAEIEYEGSERDDDENDYDDRDEEGTSEGETITSAEEGDTSISDEERGDKVELDNDDDDPVDTSSNHDPDEEIGRARV